MPARVAADPIARRIAERRRTLGLSLAEIATRAGLKAPSFLHHIERGERLPSEAVAARLALALGDDEELYRAWVRARSGAPLERGLAAARLLERHLAGARAEAPPGEPADTSGRESAPPLLMRVPRLAWGADPGDSTTPATEPLEVLRLDPRALPEEAWLRPFAYRLADGVGLPAPLLPHDLVLITRNAWPLHPTALYLIRTGQGTRLSRLAWRAGTLWLVFNGTGDPEQLPPSGHPPRILLGRVAAVIRAVPPPRGP